MKTERYENASQVVCAAPQTLEREEQRYVAKPAALRAAIDNGDASGITRDDVFARIRKTIGLHAPAAQNEDSVPDL